MKLTISSGSYWNRSDLGCPSFNTSGCCILLVMPSMIPAVESVETRRMGKIVGLGSDVELVAIVRS